MEEVTFRKAVREDVPLILEFIKGLAEYEKMSDEVVATEEILDEWIRPVLPQFFHLPWPCGHLSGRLVREAKVQGKWIREGNLEASGPDRGGAGMRAAGMVLPGLESAKH